jgi:hypothetical protein
MLIDFLREALFILGVAEQLAHTVIEIFRPPAKMCCDGLLNRRHHEAEEEINEDQAGGDFQDGRAEHTRI